MSPGVSFQRGAGPVCRQVEAGRWHTFCIPETIRSKSSNLQSGHVADDRKRISRNDRIFIRILLAAVLVMSVLFYGNRSGRGAEVLVTVDGEEYGRYPLSEEREVPVQADGVTTNLLVIRDGYADMTEADCPDRLCVHQKAISRANETIVCLPNRVVVQVLGGGESGLDAIAK